MDRQRPRTSPSSVQSFRSRNAIYRRGGGSTLHDPKDYSSYEGVLEPAGPGIWFDPEVGNDPRWQKRWNSTERVELRLTPTRMVLVRRGGARRSSPGSYNPAGQGRPTRRCALGSSPGCRAKSGLVAEAARAKATRGMEEQAPVTSSATESRPADGRGSPWHR